jgi:hypothetical protein
MLEFVRLWRAIYTSTPHQQSTRVEYNIVNNGKRLVRTNNIIKNFIEALQRVEQRIDRGLWYTSRHLRHMLLMKDEICMRMKDPIHWINLKLGHFP